jgi:hypothetical protein
VNCAWMKELLARSNIPMRKNLFIGKSSGCGFNISIPETG